MCHNGKGTVTWIYFGTKKKPREGSLTHEVLHNPFRYRFFYLRDIWVIQEIKIFIIQIFFITLFIPLTNTKQYISSRRQFVLNGYSPVVPTASNNTIFSVLLIPTYSSQEVQKALVLNVRLHNTNAIITEIIERFLADLDPLLLWNLLFSCLMILF